MRIIGYGVVGLGEADRYMENTLKEFARLCDDVVLCLNNAGKKEKELIKKYGFRSYEDPREWGKFQPIMKEYLIRKKVAELKPDICLPLDMDEIYDSKLTKAEVSTVLGNNDGGYVFIANLIGDEKHYSPSLSFWDARIWRWDERFLGMDRQPVHCGMIPKLYYFHGVYLPVLLKHYGLMNKEERQRKAERYDLYDPQAQWKGKSYYDSLRSDISVENFSEDTMREVVKKEVLGYGYQHKKIPMPEEKRFIYVRRKKDGYVFDMGEAEWKTLQEDKNRNNDFEYVSDVKMDVAEDVFVPPPIVDDPLECKTCGFIAKSDFGLTVHQRKHAESSVQTAQISDNTGS
ncbi:MAG: hypothetical protein AAB922_03170 [Patescibacteria group bacterium]